MDVKIKGVESFNHGQLMPHHSLDLKKHQDVAANMPGLVGELFTWTGAAVRIMSVFCERIFVLTTLAYNRSRRSSQQNMKRWFH